MSEERLDKLEDAIVNIKTLQQEQLKSFFLQVKNLNEQFKNIKDGKAATIGRNVLIDKINTCVRETNKVSSEIAQLKSYIDKILRRIAESQGKSVEEFLK